MAKLAIDSASLDTHNAGQCLGNDVIFSTDVIRQLEIQERRFTEHRRPLAAFGRSAEILDGCYWTDRVRLG